MFLPPPSLLSDGIRLLVDLLGPPPTTLLKWEWDYYRPQVDPHYAADVAEREMAERLVRKGGRAPGGGEMAGGQGSAAAGEGGGGGQGTSTAAPVCSSGGGCSCQIVAEVQLA